MPERVPYVPMDKSVLSSVSGVALNLQFVSFDWYCLRWKITIDILIYMKGRALCIFCGL